MHPVSSNQQRSQLPLFVIAIKCSCSELLTSTIFSRFWGSKRERPLVVHDPFVWLYLIGVQFQGRKNSGHAWLQTPTSTVPPIYLPSTFSLFRVFEIICWTGLQSHVYREKVSDRVDHVSSDAFPNVKSKRWVFLCLWASLYSSV